MNRRRSQILVSPVSGSSGAPGVKETVARHKLPLEEDLVSAVTEVKARETNAEVDHLNKVEDYQTYVDLINMKRKKEIIMVTNNCTTL